MNRPPKRRDGSIETGSDRSGAGDARGRLGFTVWTAVFGAAGVLTAALGFYLLAEESITAAPFLLLLAFLVFFPLALVK
jgi:hypothetical protein